MIPIKKLKAQVVIDAMGHEAYIPDQFVLKIYYHAATKEVCAITMPKKLINRLSTELSTPVSVSSRF